MKKKQNLDPDAIASGEGAVSGTDESKNQVNYKSVYKQAVENPFVKEFLKAAKRGNCPPLPVGRESVPIGDLCDPNCEFKDPETGLCPIDLSRILEALGLYLASTEVLSSLLSLPKCKFGDYYFQTKVIEEDKSPGKYTFSFAVLLLLDSKAPLDKVKELLKKAEKLGNKDAAELLKKLK